MLKLFYIVLFLLVQNLTKADTIINYGVGVAKSATGVVGETKTVGLGYTDDFSGLFHYKLEVGGWTDTRGDQSRKGSGYGSLAPGLSFVARPFTLSSYHGLGYITSPDSYLGSHTQFTHDVCAGFKDDLSSGTMSICYKHISNAGLFSNTNVGRDFIYIRLGF